MERTAYRIIDANFNRAREALRVMEEFCRFELNSKPLWARAKQMRHTLCSIIARLDPSRLIASRDTLADVGVGQTVENQMGRGNLRDCFTAASKRLPEALRALAEVTETLDPKPARDIENLRYAAYTLEKDIVLFADAAEKFKNVRLYVIISSHLPAEVLSLTQFCIAGQADCIQLRAKGIQDDVLFAVAREFVRLCRDGRVLSIINDRVDIAAAAGADGVHLGQNDLPVTEARRLQLSPMIIGKSTHSPEQLIAACAEAPAYAALGPVFATGTKPTAQPLGLEYVEKGVEMLAETGISHVAIGGITPDNVGQVLLAGARAVAVCSAVTESADPTAVCRTLKEKITLFDKR